MACHSSGSDWASRLGANMVWSRKAADSTLRIVKLALLLVALCCGLAHAYPTKPVRVIVAFTPGGATDIIARTLMPRLAELWGQPVVVENRPGAGGSLAAQIVARAAADGATPLVHSSGYSIHPALNPPLPFDPPRDFIEGRPPAGQAQVLVGNPASGIRSVAELIAAAKSQPGAGTYGSSGI